MCGPNSERDRWTTTTLQLVVAVLLTAGEVHNLKCRTTDQSRRQGEFIDIAEQCKNQTARRTPSSSQENDYPSAAGYNNGSSRDNRMDSGRRPGNHDGRRNNNREYNVHRQDFGDIYGYGNGNDDRGNSNSEHGDSKSNRGNVRDRGNSNSDRGNGGDRSNSDRGDGGDRSNSNRGNGGDRSNSNRGNGSDRSNSEDRDSTSCNVQQSSEYSGGRRGDHKRQGNSYNPSVDYDAKQSNFNTRQLQHTRRYRRDVYNKNNNRRSAAVTTTGRSRLLGDNRFRNVTKNGSNQAKGSILEDMDACTIHCVFNQLEMLNSATSRPDKPSIVNIMTNQIKDVELKEFIQDSIEECFDTLELDYHNTKCEFSKNFAICMENKAEKNCDDWDEIDMQSANKMNSAQDGDNNQPDKRKGY